MKLRLASPRHLVDINGIPGLAVHPRGRRLPADRRADPRVGAGGVGARPGSRIRSSTTPARSSRTRWCGTWPPSAATSPTAIRPTTIPPPCWPRRRGRRGRARGRAPDSHRLVLHRALRDRAAARRDPRRDPRSPIPPPAAEAPISSSSGRSAISPRPRWPCSSRWAPTATCEQVGIGLTNVGLTPIKAERGRGRPEGPAARRGDHQAGGPAGRRRVRARARICGARWSTRRISSGC